MKVMNFLGIIILVFISLYGCSTISDPETQQWFSEADAGKLRLSEQDIQILTAQSKAYSVDGPGVAIIYPQLSEGEGMSRWSRVPFNSPTNLDVEFTENQAPIDFETLRVRGKKFGFSKDITEEVLPHLQGNKLLVRNLDLPEGKFLIEFEIADTEGRKTEQEYFVDSR